MKSKKTDPDELYTVKRVKEDPDELYTVKSKDRSDELYTVQSQDRSTRTFTSRRTQQKAKTAIADENSTVQRADSSRRCKNTTSTPLTTGFGRGLHVVVSRTIAAARARARAVGDQVLVVDDDLVVVAGGATLQHVGHARAVPQHEVGVQQAAQVLSNTTKKKEREFSVW